jgi:5-methylcytosine-specific restriction endonuclease McrA
MALSWGEQLKDPRWIRKYDEIKERDNRTCLICNSNEHHVEVHHLCYLPGFLAWEYDNELLVTICRRHHDQVTYDMPKVSGLIAFQALKGNVDLSNLVELLESLHV